MSARILLCVLFACTLQAEVRLPAVISDHMLIQRDAPARVWGKADPGEEVSVRFRNQTLTTRADGLGRWSVYLAPEPAGGPHELAINNLIVRDVLVGDVWVGSGQSNMEWSVARSDNAEKEIAAANHPAIRLFKVARKVSDVPLDDVQGQWAVCSPDTVKDFSAVGYYFARDLNERLKTPIGVIQSAWGGTPAEAWTSQTALARDPFLLPALSDWARALAAFPEANERFQVRLKEWEAMPAANRPPRPGPPTGPGNPWTPAGLYNAMIAPLTPYAIRGVIWYQGESNTGPSRFGIYNRLFETMIRDWRQSWGQGDFPFLFVQLANFGKVGAGSRWPELREAQLETLALRNTGMAVTIDIGNPADIHPTNKQDVGKRLALAARAIAYGDQLLYSGPIFRQATKQGSTLRIIFDHAGSGLKAAGGTLKSFEIAGANGHFVPAEAKVDGTTLIVSSPSVTDPVHVRYAWSESPEANLYNSADLPASPFRGAVAAR